MLGEVAYPTFSNGDTFTQVQKKCAEYAAARALEDLQRNGHVTSSTGIQSYVDECAARLDQQRSMRQALILTVGIGAAGFAAYWLWNQR